MRCYKQCELFTITEGSVAIRHYKTEWFEKKRVAHCTANQDRIRLKFCCRDSHSQRNVIFSIDKVIESVMSFYYALETYISVYSQLSLIAWYQSLAV